MPRTLAENATYIKDTIKPAIKSAIEAQGVTVPSTDSFLDYADRIGEIEGGGSGYQLKDLPSGSISTVTDAAPLPLNALKVSVEAVQSGSGTPSPSNIRPIRGWDSGEITVCDDIDNPTQTETTTLDFPQTIYGAEWDVVGGGMKEAQKSIIVTQVSRNDARSYYVIPPVACLRNNFSTIKSDKLPTATSTTVVGVYTNAVGAILINTANEYATAADMIADFGGSIQVVYELATPTTIDLSPLSIRMLQGTNNVYADCGEVIEGEYFVGETKAYDLVEYIESDGTQVIDTGRQVVQGQTIEVTFEGSSNQTAYAWIFGGITSSDYYGYQFPNSSTVYSYNGGTSASSQSGFSSNVLTQKALTFNGSANANIHILGLLDGSAYSNQGKFKVYFLDIDGDYFVPAKRRSDGVYGLYDIANSQFLTDVASGNALTGGESLGIRIG